LPLLSSFAADSLHVSPFSPALFPKITPCFSQQNGKMRLDKKLFLMILSFCRKEHRSVATQGMSPFETRLYTASQLGKAGEILKRDDASPEESEWALQVLRNYRSLFNAPLNTFQAGLVMRIKRQKNGAFLVAQRIKRLPTIFDKLHRFKDMKLQRMHDIGGIRAVVADMHALDELYRSYIERRCKKGRAFIHEQIRQYDYVSRPKDSGYRGRHLVFRYHNERDEMKCYNGLTIEMQLRTKLQHIWATAVETFEAYLGEKFKSSMGNQEWLDFFSLLSSAFALEEKQPVVPAFQGMTEAEIRCAIREKVRKLDVLELISAFSQVTRSLSDRRARSSGYHVLIFDSREKDSWVRDFKDYDQAYRFYSGEERRSQGEPSRQVVLVKVDSIAKLRKAYPNYFADLGELKIRLEHLMRQE